MTITSADLIGLGIISNHCDTKKLQIAVNEAVQFDLRNLLGNLFFLVNENWDQTSPGIYFDIVEPKNYTNCSGYETTHVGLKKVLAYYSYSRYILINSFNDTPNGLVEKSNNFSIPKSLDELQSFSSKYRNMGLEDYRLVEAYILLNSATYPSYNTTCAKPCGCNGTCGKKTTNKGFGIRSKTIVK
tara:strand:+ start:18368 stop:18925 length:558 start_codon:yes stop_codon:yes gene_type:complete